MALAVLGAVLAVGSARGGLARHHEARFVRDGVNESGAALASMEQRRNEQAGTAEAAARESAAWTLLLSRAWVACLAAMLLAMVLETEALMYPAGLLDELEGYKGCYMVFRVCIRLPLYAAMLAGVVTALCEPRRGSATRCCKRWFFSSLGRAPSAPTVFRSPRRVQRHPGARGSASVARSSSCWPWVAGSSGRCSSWSCAC